MQIYLNKILEGHYFLAIQYIREYILNLISYPPPGFFFGLMSKYSYVYFI